MFPLFLLSVTSLLILFLFNFLYLVHVIAFSVAGIALIVVSLPWLHWNFLIHELLAYKLTVASGFCTLPLKRTT